jgi:hypothetical protein
MGQRLLTATETRLDTWILSQPELRWIDVEDPRVVRNANTDESLRRYFG